MKDCFFFKTVCNQWSENKRLSENWEEGYGIEEMCCHLISTKINKYQVLMRKLIMNIFIEIDTLMLETFGIEGSYLMRSWKNRISNSATFLQCRD